MAHTHRIGINPLPWILGDMAYRLDRSVIEQALTDLAPIGFDHLTVEIPEGWTTAEYGTLLADHGFSAAPGYFSGTWADRSTHAALVEKIKAHAAAHAELGLDRAFIAHDLTPERIARPAVGAGSDPATSGVIAEGLALAAGVAAAEGVRYALHPHVGSLVETGEEIRAVLDATAGSSLYFGPDTGHLFWAGSDPAGLMSQYSDRIIAVHLKDVDPAAAPAAISAGDDYMQATNGRHVWTEPGRGAVDFDGVFAALPVDYDGWFIIEVDVPNAPTAVESSQLSFDFVERHPFFAGVAA